MHVSRPVALTGAGATLLLGLPALGAGYAAATDNCATISKTTTATTQLCDVKRSALSVGNLTVTKAVSANTSVHILENIQAGGTTKEQQKSLKLKAFSIRPGTKVLNEGRNRQGRRVYGEYIVKSSDRFYVTPQGKIYKANCHNHILPIAIKKAPLPVVRGPVTFVNSFSHMTFTVTLDARFRQSVTATATCETAHASASSRAHARVSGKVTITINVAAGSSAQATSIVLNSPVVQRRVHVSASATANAKIASRLKADVRVTCKEITPVPVAPTPPAPQPTVAPTTPLPAPTRSPSATPSASASPTTPAAPSPSTSPSPSPTVVPTTPVPTVAPTTPAPQPTVVPTTPAPTQSPSPVPTKDSGGAIPAPTHVPAPGGNPLPSDQPGLPNNGSNQCYDGEGAATPALPDGTCPLPIAA